MLNLDKTIESLNTNPGWPAQFSPKQVSSNAIAPFVLPLLANPRCNKPYLIGLKNRLIDLTVRMAREHTKWYAEVLTEPIGRLTTESFSRLPFVTRNQLTERREDFIAGITTFAFASFTGGTTSQAPLMIERSVEEQTYLSNLIANALKIKSLPEMSPLGLVAVNGSHGEVFRVPGHGYSFSINFDQDSSFHKSAWLLQQEFSFPGFESKISFIQGYFEFIHLLALFLKEKGIIPKPGQIRSVACYGMAIPESRRAEVSEIFSAPVSDNFSLGEVHGSAPFNPKDSTYVFSPFVHAEVVDLHTDQPIEYGSGELVVTTLFPFTQRFPLIRYRTGDLVFTPGKVAIGPLFRVRGRLTNSVLLVKNHVLSESDVLFALEDLPFVARRKSYTQAVHNAARAAGPKFKLAKASLQGAELTIEINQSSQCNIDSDDVCLSAQVRTNILEALPEDTRTVLKENPELMLIRFVKELK